MRFKRYSCGCVGCDLGWKDAVVIVRRCDRDGRNDVRWHTEADVVWGTQEMSASQKQEAVLLNAAECEVWMRRIAKQLWEGQRLWDLRYLLLDQESRLTGMEEQPGKETKQ